MKQVISLLILALLAGRALAATAYFTGKQEMVQSVTGRVAWNCEYNYAGNMFWRAFAGMCPNSAEVE